MKTEISVESPDAPKQVVRQRGKERLPWQRMALSCLGITIVLLMWRWAVWHLYSLPEHSMTSFTSFTNNAFYVIGAIVVFMVTGRLVYEWKNQTASTVVETAQHLSERINENRTEHVVNEQIVRDMSERYRDDESYRPLNTIPDLEETR